MSRLEEISLPFRTCSIVRNDYDNNDQYVVGHPDALSTGDEDGKGEMNGEVGGLTDIKCRKALIAKNKFNQNNCYYAGTA